MATGLVFDERFLKHDTGEAGLFITAGENFIEPEEHVENPRRIGRTKNLLDRSGLTASLVNLPARRASEEEMGLYHTREQIEAIRTLCARGGEDGYFPLNSGLSHEIGEGQGKGYTVNLPLPAATAAFPPISQVS